MKSTKSKAAMQQRLAKIRCGQSRSFYCTFYYFPSALYAGGGESGENIKEKRSKNGKRSLQQVPTKGTRIQIVRWVVSTFEKHRKGRLINRAIMRTLSSSARQQVISRSEGMTLMVIITGEKDIQTEPPFMIFKDVERSYPMQGILKDLPTAQCPQFLLLSCTHRVLQGAKSSNC